MGLLDGLKKLFRGKKPRRRKVSKNKVDVARRFDLQGRTGQGSMSRVFVAYDRTLGRKICLKLLDKEKTDKFEQRFAALDKPSEGEICMALRHPGIVTCYEHGITGEGEPFLVMELVDGLGLNYLIDNRASNTQLKGNRINFLIQLCEALEYLHGQKYLHRDICPRNIMVTKDGVVKLIDFGLTVPYRPEFCQPGNRTGTLDYLALELIKRMTTDHRIDVFALGVTAYEVLTGVLPWERALSSEDTLRRRMNEKPRNPRQFNPDLEEDVIAVILKSIDNDAKSRYQTVNAMKKALLGIDRNDY